MLKTIVPVCALALVIHSTLVYGQGTSAIAGQNPASSTQGIITTVVGTDFAYPNQALPALNAPLGAAVAVALDPAGNLYVADSSNSIVLKMDAAGILTVVAGNRKPGFSGDGGPATNAALNLPSGIALDSSSNLFIADSGNNRIRKVTPSGVITTIAGNGNSGFSGDGAAATQAALSHPGAVAVDNAGNVFVADNRNGRIRKITATGNITTVAGNGAISSTTSTVPAPGDGGPATQAPVYFPTGIAVDQNGALWIAGDFVLRQVSPSGVISSIALPIGTCTSISTELALDGAGDVFVSNAPCGYVFKMKPGGAFTLIAGNAPENLSKAFSGDGGPALTAGLNEPMGLALDAAGNLYIADSGNGRIRQINSSAIINTVAGNGSYRFGGDGAPPLSAYLSSPVGVAVGKDGNLYIADTANNRIRKVAGGRISTVAGSGGRGFSGDGGPATSASLNLPLGVAADEAGNVYIADATNSRLRKATRDGIINTILGGGGSVALDSSDDVFTTDAATVYELTADGKSLVVARNNPQSSNPGDGGPATATRLFFVISVAVDAAGNVFIADRSGQRVRKVTTDGVIHTVAGNGTAGFSGDGGPATAASLNTPYGIALDAVGDLYIADQGNHRVRVVTPDGIINTLVGTGVPALSGDGGPPGSATLNGPSGLAVDPAGNLYIGDTGNNRIREVLIAAASYQATPADLSFSGAAGGSDPGGQIINLASDAGLAFTASSNAPWLGVNPASGAMPATLQVTADPSTLSAGTYKGIITLTVPYAVPATAAIAVTFTVSPATPAILSADTQNVTLSATQGGSAVAQQLRITCTGSGPLDFTASTTVSSPAGGSWLSVSATSGTVTPSSAALLTVIASPGTLASGTYSGTVTIAGGGKNLAIPVTMSVSPPTATILLSQSALSFTAVAQGGVPLPQNFGILNIGQGSMSWVASASTLSGGGWLHISPLNGTVNRPYLDVSLVDVSIDPGTLGAGTYYGRIQVSAVAANTPQLITVILTVLPPGFTLGAQVFPAGLIFTGAAGLTPGSQDVQVANPSGTVNSFQSGIIGVGLDSLPKAATLQSSQPATIHVYPPDFGTLSGGSLQRGTITLQFSDGSPAQTINVLTVVAPSGTTSNSLSANTAFGEATAQPEASGCAKPGLFVVFRAPQPSQSTFSAAVGQGTTMDVQVSDGCGSLVGPGGQSASVKAVFSNGDSAVMTHIGNGIWQGTWRPLTAGNTSMIVTALAAQQNGGIVAGQSSTLTAVVNAPAPATATPAVTAQGVVHAASDVGGAPISPGGLITVYGMNLADGVGQSSSLPLPGQLNGTQVLLGNQVLPILYTSPGQLNVQVPYGVPVNTQYQLTVQHGNTYSVPQQLVVAQAQPGIFTVNQAGSGQGSIVKSDGVTLAQPGSPASIGETVVIYCTGLGAVTPTVIEGAPPPASPLSQTVNPVTVTIGGKPATVSFAGLTPGDPGLYQINAVVPSGIVTGDAVPVVISVAGQSSPISPAVTMAVK